MKVGFILTLKKICRKQNTTDFDKYVLSMTYRVRYYRQNVWYLGKKYGLIII